MKENALEFCSWSLLYNRYKKNILYHQSKKKSEIVRSFNDFLFFYKSWNIYWNCSELNQNSLIIILTNSRIKHIKAGTF